MRLEPGDRTLIEVGGGGGFYSPLQREAERVLADVRAGYVSRESAERDYGVVIQQRGRDFSLDLQATANLRALRAR